MSGDGGICQARGVTAVLELDGLRELHAETMGDPRVCVALLDGPVDRGHPCLRGAHLTRIETLAPGTPDGGSACRHGTHLAGLLFGQPGGPLTGIAPGCRGLVVPIFSSGPGGGLVPCSQLDLARAILQAVRHGAHVLNVSGGQLAPGGRAHPFLADAVRYCASEGALIVAAAGNEGCACLYVPAALPSVLAVGAMDRGGRPLGFSNWGEAYRAQGLIAPGQDVPGAGPGGGVGVLSGTSAAAAVVTGIVALGLSLQVKLGRRPGPLAVGAALLRSARGCDHQPVPDCRRLLAGRLDVRGATALILRGVDAMSAPFPPPENDPPPPPDPDVGPGSPVRSPPAGVRDAAGVGPAVFPGPPPPAPALATPIPPPSPERAGRGTLTAGRVVPSSCGCGCGGGGPAQLVYPLGSLGWDFGTEARRDSIAQHMREPARGTPPNPHDPGQLLDHLEGSPWDAAAIIWTLSLDATPIYAVQPDGPFAGEVCQRLRSFLREQLTEGVERVSVPGVITGHVTLLSGQAVPVIRPEIRGIYSWTTSALVKSLAGASPPEGAPGQAGAPPPAQAAGVQNFLERVYFEVRNLGVTPQERALNYAATNAFSVGQVFESAIRDEMELDTIDVVPSPINRPGSDTWDVRLHFFYPKRQVQTVRKVYRLTVDVSDVVPVMVGPVRSWFVR